MAMFPLDGMAAYPTTALWQARMEKAITDGEIHLVLLEVEPCLHWVPLDLHEGHCMHTCAPGTTGLQRTTLRAAAEPLR